MEHCDKSGFHLRRAIASAVWGLTLLFAIPADGQTPTKIEVFTLSTIALTNTGGATIYYVDGISQIQNFLSAGLPSEPTAARAIARQRWDKLGREGNQRLQNAGVGLGRAVQYRINRAPAVVFDEKAVVYGVTDVAHATQIYLGSLRALGRK